MIAVMRCGWGLPVAPAAPAPGCARPVARVSTSRQSEPIKSCGSGGVRVMGCHDTSARCYAQWESWAFLVGWHRLPKPPVMVRARPWQLSVFLTGRMMK